ncbi:unnamed protein product, partial [marine sediment metagenome]
ITLYPRFWGLTQGTIFRFRENCRKFLQVYRKSELTAITFTYNEAEIFLSINKKDYQVLGDRTFHLLGNRILESVKKSFLEFTDNNFSQAYLTLFPMAKIGGTEF